MAFTYTADPQHVARDAVRWWCGDTDSTVAQLQDSEVDYAISMQPSDARLAGALCCDALAAKYARRADITIGEVSKRFGDRAQVFRDQAAHLRAEVGKGAVPFFGGQSRSGKADLREDADAVQPPFGVGQFDNPLSRQFDGEAPDALTTGNT
jgi:hypothetical protein